MSFRLETKPEPDADSLLRWLVDGLSVRGVSSSDPENIDYARVSRMVIAGVSIYVLVGLIGDGPRQWLVSTNEMPGLWDRLRRRRHMVEHAELCRRIHELLTAQQHVHDVRWYTTVDWNEQPDTGWFDAPNSDTG